MLRCAMADGQKKETTETVSSVLSSITMQMQQAQPIQLLSPLPGRRVVAEGTPFSLRLVLYVQSNTVQ